MRYHRGGENRDGSRVIEHFYSLRFEDALDEGRRNGETGFSRLLALSFWRVRWAM